MESQSIPDSFRLGAARTMIVGSSVIGIIAAVALALIFNRTIRPSPAVMYSTVAAEGTALTFLLASALVCYREHRRSKQIDLLPHSTDSKLPSLPSKADPDARDERALPAEATISEDESDSEVSVNLPTPSDERVLEDSTETGDSEETDVYVDAQSTIEDTDEFFECIDSNTIPEIASTKTPFEIWQEEKLKPTIDAQKTFLCRFVSIYGEVMNVNTDRQREKIAHHLDELYNKILDEFKDESFTATEAFKEEIDALIFEPARRIVTRETNLSFIQKNIVNVLLGTGFGFNTALHKKVDPEIDTWFAQQTHVNKDTLKEVIKKLIEPVGHASLTYLVNETFQERIKPVFEEVKKIKNLPSWGAYLTLLNEKLSKLGTKLA